MASETLLRLAPAMAGAYRLWTASLKLRVEGLEGLVERKREGRQFVFALWHDEMFGLIAMHRTITGLPPARRPLLTMASQSKDGELIARVLDRLGFAVCRGSSSRGGLKALLKATNLMLGQRMDAAITVDGPRGPRHVAKEGAVFLAARTSALIVPARIGYARPHVFRRAWDHFQLPWPGSACRVVFGEPYALAEHALTREGLAEETRRLQTLLDGLAPSLFPTPDKP